MPDLRDQLQATLSGSYTLERELGGGGMSRVFVAEEKALGRRVVVKILPGATSAQVSLERFKREILLAAKLQHPHIVPLLSAGESDGLPYFTMPFVEGESLRARLARHGELPVSDAIRILREIASALAYAHEHGIVHRDIKPDNVLLSGGSAMVTDFGVAKALSASSNAEHAGVTSLGVALGTPAYMSPEQATADPAIDHRADIYAFGVLAYELLTGQPPFTGRTPQNLLAAHVGEAPEPISRRRQTLPPALSALVMRALEKRPADRPQSAAEIVSALDAITTPSGGTQPTSAVQAVRADGDGRPRTGLMIAAAIAVVAAMIAGGIWLGRGAFGSAEKTLGVLPFDAGSDTSIAYIADGITEGLTTALSNVPGLVVRPHYSSKAMKGRALADAGARLHVASIVQATMRRAGSVLRVNVQLLNVANESVIWGGSFDASQKDPLAIQDSVVASVTRALRVALAPATQAAAGARRTESPEVRDLILRARFLEDQFTEASFTSAKSMYERAIALDSTSAEAWAGLANCWASLADDWIAPHLAYPPAKVAALRALTLDSTSAESHAALASIVHWSERDYALADREFRRALDIDSMSVGATWYSYTLAAMGLRDSAATVALRLLRRHPLSYAVATQQSHLLTETGHIRDAEAVCLRIDTLKIGSSDECGAWVYWRTKRYPQGLAAARRAFEKDPTPTRQASLAYGLALTGDVAGARAALNQVLETAKRRYVREESVALAYLALGERDKALDWLERLLASGGAALTGLARRPEWDPIRGDPRFQSVLRRSLPR